MTATVLPFPRRPAAPPTLGELLIRRTDPNLDYFEREQIAVCIDAYRAVGHVITMSADPEEREAAISACVTSLERALFHALSLQGCPNHSRDLYQLIASRQAGRENGHG